MTFRPVEELSLNLEITHSQSDGGLDPFELLRPSDFSIPGIHFLPMTRVYSYSDLEVTESRVEVSARYDFRPAWWVQARYEYGDFSDDDPYLYDLSGRGHFYSLMFGHSF